MFRAKCLIDITVKRTNTSDIERIGTERATGYQLAITGRWSASSRIVSACFSLYLSDP